jgi:hypothetical protein
MSAIAMPIWFFQELINHKVLDKGKNLLSKEQNNKEINALHDRSEKANFNNSLNPLLSCMAIR